MRSMRDALEILGAFCLGLAFWPLIVCEGVFGLLKLLLG
jgi:hypothetical protein